LFAFGGETMARVSGRWFSLSPGLRLAWACVSAALLAAFVAGDWVGRLNAGHSFLAPTAADLWLATGLGAVLGAAGSA
jgi:hypothetical protein